MEDGTYGIKMLEEKGFECKEGALKSKPKEDCRTFSCKKGSKCTLTNVAQELYGCVESPVETKVTQDKDQYIKTLEQEIRQLKERVQFLEAKLNKYEPQQTSTKKVCGNSVCEQGETLFNCASDCQQKRNSVECGDNICTSGYEDKESCFEDCASAEEKANVKNQLGDWLQTI